MIHQDLARNSQRTQPMSAKKADRLMLFSGTVGIYCENHIEHTNTKCDKMSTFITVQQVVHIFITDLYVVSDNFNKPKFYSGRN